MKKIDFSTDPRVHDVGLRLPYTLFKYIRTDDETTLARLKRLIVNGEMFFSRPSAFNDPFDCAVAPSYDATADAIRDYVREWMRRNGRDPAAHSAEVEEHVARSDSKE